MQGQGLYWQRRTMIGDYHGCCVELVRINLLGDTLEASAAAGATFAASHIRR